MDITKESFLKAEDPKNRDSMLFDMLENISAKIDICNELKNENTRKIEKCQKDISIIKGIIFGLSAILSTIAAWFGFIK